MSNKRNKQALRGKEEPQSFSYYDHFYFGLRILYPLSFIRSERNTTLLVLNSLEKFRVHIFVAIKNRVVYLYSYYSFYLVHIFELVSTNSKLLRIN